ncbi:MAG: glutathione S-transferase family protein [Myxococcales bacterium]|nr:glutathione S-transferase family protein [Myxococcales bacterium]
MSDLVLYTHPFSRARIAHWALEETGQTWQARLVPLGEHRTPDFLALNPMGKIPTLVHGDVVVTEAPAICAYLADAFPEAGLAPAPADRGAYYRWLFFAAACIEHAMFDKENDQLRDKQRGAIGYGTFEQVVDTIEAAITPGPWVLGERFSAADVYLGSQLEWGTRLMPHIERRPAFDAYLARCTAREAYQRASERTDALAAQLEG